MKERHQPAEKVVSTPPPHLSTMCPTEGIFYYQKFIKTYSFGFFPKGRFFVMLSAEKEAIFFDHRRIYQVERKVPSNAVCYDLHGNYGIDKRWIHRTERI